MKRKGLFLILLCLALTIPPALADTVIVAGTNGFDDTIDGMCAIDDTIWFAGSHSQSIHRCDAATATLESYPWNDACAREHQGITSPDGDTIFQGIAAWFAWNDEPCVLAYRYSANARTITNAAVYRVDIIDGEAALTETAAIDWEPLIFDDYLQLEGACVVDGVLCSILYSGRYFTLALTPLDGGKTILTGIQAECVCPYNGMALVSRADYRSRTMLTTADVHTGSVVNEIALESVPELAGLAQEPDSNRVLFVSDGSLMAYDPAIKALERIAGLSASYDFQDSAAATLDKGLYAISNHDSLTIRQLHDRPESLELTVAEGHWVDGIESTAQAYSAAHPEITVVRTHPENIIDSLLTHTLDADILVLSSTDDQAFPAVLGRQWAAPLDSKALREAVSGMYPVIAETFMPDGELIGVPLSAFSRGMSLSVGALERLELTMDDIPTNWPDFLCFLESQKGNAKAAVFGDDMGTPKDTRRALLQLILRTSMLNVQAGHTSQFDTPELRQALLTLEAMDIDGIIEADAQLADYEVAPLFNSYDFVGVDGDTFTDRWSGYPLILSLSPDVPAPLPVECVAAFINPDSPHIAEAVDFLETAFSRVPHDQLAMLHPAMNESEYDEAGYQRSLNDSRAEEARVRQQIAQDGSNEQSLQDRLNSLQEWTSRMRDYFWVISAQTLDWYRAHDEGLMLEKYSILMGRESYDAISQYIDGRMTMNSLIRTMDKKEQMRRLEAE